MAANSKFLRVKCSKCKATQIIFGKASSKVKCIACNGTLSDPAGGKAKIRARIEEVL
jgi:small subunit ribosomal protein S27e